MSPAGGKEMGMNLEQDLRYTSDEMMRALERLRLLETRKRKMKPGTDAFQKLAKEVEELAGRVFFHTQEQERLATESVELVEAALIDPHPIDEVPPNRQLQIILSEWRDAERRLAEATPGTVQASDANADIERLRLEYRRAAQASWNEEETR
ncbi:MAG TPA: hypothetical protein VK992_00185 [Candidatus Caenarcaniphilales bacterium]|nr:hypothetical protein [Candidatus Caenarcaniphilales bacterium]